MKCCIAQSVQIKVSQVNEFKMDFKRPIGLSKMEVNDIEVINGYFVNLN